MGIPIKNNNQWAHVHDDVIKWKHFPRYWPFVLGIHQKGQWRRALMFSLICAWINSWVNKREPGDLSRHSSHYDVIVMQSNYNQITYLAADDDHILTIQVLNMLKSSLICYLYIFSSITMVMKHQNFKFREWFFICCKQKSSFVIVMHTDTK